MHGKFASSREKNCKIMVIHSHMCFYLLVEGLCFVYTVISYITFECGTRFHYMRNKKLKFLEVCYSGYIELEEVRIGKRSQYLSRSLFNMLPDRRHNLVESTLLRILNLHLKGDKGTISSWISWVSWATRKPLWYSSPQSCLRSS